MNKTFIVGLISLLVGGGAGFLVGKTVYKKFYEDLAQEEIDSVKATFAERYKNEQSASDTSDNGVTDEEYEEREEKPKPVRNNVTPLTRSSIEANQYEKAKRNYNLYHQKSEPQPDPKEEDDEEEDEEPRDAAGKTEKEMMDLTKVDRTQPYIIDDDEYTDEFPHHNKVSLYYYHEDEVLCEDEEIIRDVEQIVGDEAIPLLDEHTTVWVRNEPLCIDYEIVGIRGSYAELVEAVKPAKNLSPRERYEKKQKERKKSEE